MSAVIPTVATVVTVYTNREVAPRPTTLPKS